MSEFLVSAAAFVLAMVALGLVRILRGPRDADRLMAAQLIGTGGIAALLLLAAGTGVSAVVDAALTLALLAACVAVLPGSFKQFGNDGTPADIEAFTDWRQVIPPDSTVLKVPSGNSASFIWFTLGRASYLTVDQSAGVVFSAATAKEVRRRATVLLPIEKPDWRILTHNAAETAVKDKPRQATLTPFTSQNLSAICRDTLLGFVIAQENVGFDPLRHPRAGSLENLYLYDCRRVRSAAPAT